MARLGFSVTRTGSALVYIGSVSKNPHKATLEKVNCRMKRAFYFKADERCEFYLNTMLTSGSMTVEMLDTKKNVVFILNNENKNGVIKVDEKSKYHVVFHFDNASGKFEFGWK